MTRHTVTHPNAGILGRPTDERDNPLLLFASRGRCKVGQQRLASDDDDDDDER
jgi:hypothetical protein